MDLNEITEVAEVAGNVKIVNEYLSEGWIIINTFKDPSVDIGFEGETLYYHLGKRDDPFGNPST